MSTKIEWTEKTWNPVVGCTPVSPGCLNCYAATMARRLEAMGRPEYAPREEPLTGPDLRAAHASVGGGKLHDHERVKEIRIAEVKNGRAVFTGDVRTVPDRLTDPLHWRAPKMIFVNSMSDLFHEAVPFEFIDRVFAVMALCPHHTFQVLTKRPERMAEYLGLSRLDSAGRHGAVLGAAHFQTPGGESASFDWPLPNVWLGTSVERQQEADERIQHLKNCHAAVHFLSIEPLLGPVDIHDALFCPRLGPEDSYKKPLRKPISWVIVGGESGPGARPCDVAWIRGIVGQCNAAGTACFVKQLGAKPYVDSDATVRDWPGGTETRREGSRVSFKLVDKKGGTMEEWPEDLRVREFPEVKADDATTTPRL